MAELSYTLLADGSSDASLIPIINWLLRQHVPEVRILPQFAMALGVVGTTLAARLPVTLQLFPCDILFVHRDAEGQSVDLRLREIDAVLRDFDQTYVPVIPRHMSEAWLLSDEMAIRRAAGNKNGRAPLRLPSKSRWEGRRNPKADLTAALEAASAEKSARALAKMNTAAQRLKVAELTDDFSGLRGLTSFDMFESRLVEKLKGLNYVVSLD